MNEEQISFVIDATIFELKDDPTLIQRVKRSKLITVAWNRLKNAGFLSICTRCGGTGEYSFNQRDGTMCFKCSGTKWMIPRFTRKWREEVSAFDWRNFMKKVKEVS